MLATTQLSKTERRQAQFIGVRGQWVISYYQQIAHFLKMRCGKSHALLFAEPLLSSNYIEWFTAAEGAVQPFAALTPEDQTSLLERTRTLVADLQGLIAELNASPHSNQNLIGELLNNMLLFPDQNLFLVGEQPVLIGWGLKQVDAGMTWQASSTIQAHTPAPVSTAAAQALSVARRGRQSDAQPAPASPITRQRTPQPSSATPVAIPEATPTYSPSSATPAATPEATPTRPTRSREAKSWAWLWWVFLAILLVPLLLFLLLRSYGDLSIQLPTAALGWRFDPSPAQQLEAARQREQQLREELANLQDELLNQLRTCPERD